ncbi:hypothetical protein [Qipengyuania sp. JC766]|uniref:hypothetical protein n=1 Tax=Qipengyuania sp. JC766 TaxID=3232139 RepID=UPI003459128E
MENSTMYSIDQAAGQVVATDTQLSVDAADRAVISLANLCASIVEVSKASNLPVRTAQSALANAASALGGSVTIRQNVAAATAELLSIQGRSTLEAVSFGCPGGFPEPQGNDTAKPVSAKLEA